MTHVEFPEDCAKIRASLAGQGVSVTLGEAEAFWEWRSDQWCASWLYVDVDNPEGMLRWWREYASKDVTK